MSEDDFDTERYMTDTSSEDEEYSSLLNRQSDVINKMRDEYLHSATHRINYIAITFTYSVLIALLFEFFISLFPSIPSYVPFIILFIGNITAICFIFDGMNLISKAFGINGDAKGGSAGNENRVLLAVLVAKINAETLACIIAIFIAEILLLLTVFSRVPTYSPLIPLYLIFVWPIISFIFIR
jgi:hypothetical protein